MKTTISNKNVFITGANGGMGLQTSKLLASLGVKSLTLAARNQEKADWAKRSVQDQVFSDTRISAIGGLDMNSPDGIREAIEQIDKEPFDIVFLQAGGVFFTDSYQYKLWEGKRFEKTIFQNTIGAYLVVTYLKEKGLLKEDARVVFAGGEGARGIPGMIDKPKFLSLDQFDQYLHGTGDLPKYNPMNAIGVSKLTSAWLVQKLSEIDKNRTYLWFSPGLTHGTNGLSSVSPVKRFFMEKVMFGISGLLGFSQSPEKGAQKYVDALIGSIGQSGDVLGAPEKKVLGVITDQKSMNNAITNQVFIERFWEELNTMAPFINQEDLSIGA